MAEIKVEKSSQTAHSSHTVEDGQPMEAEETGDTWNEERLENALETLKEIYIQLRQLRTAIPRLVMPLTVRQPSPEVLFKKFASAAATANEELREFKRLIEDDNSKDIFKYVEESRTKKPNDIAPWKITEHPDWLTRVARKAS